MAKKGGTAEVINSRATYDIWAGVVLYRSLIARVPQNYFAWKRCYDMSESCQGGTWDEQEASRRLSEHPPTICPGTYDTAITP
jgi:hypothetical protein